MLRVTNLPAPAGTGTGNSMHIAINTAVCITSLAALTTAVSAVQKKPAARAARQAPKPTPRPVASDNSAVLTMPLRAGAPFKSVTVEIRDETSCGSLGCEIYFFGTTATGVKRDISQTDIFKNGMLGTRAEVFGAIDASGMPAIVIEQGNIDRESSFNLFRYDAKLGRYKFIGDVPGYAVGKAAAASDPGAPSVAAASAPPPSGLPATVEYMGYEGPMWSSFTLSHADGVLSGSDYMEMGVLRVTVPVKGSYANGECTVTRKSDTFRGPCDERGFHATVYNKKGKPGKSYRFVSMAELERRKAGGVASAPAQTHGASAAAPASYGVWALGRVRILTERGGRCGPAVSLGKAFCFDRAIGWLRQRPNKTEIDVIAMDQSYMPGSLVPYNGGQGWSVYRVARRGDGFAADTQRHFGSKVQVPQGCIYSGVLQNAWYITIAGGRKVAVEATQYRCSSPWAGPWLYTRGADYADADAGQLDYAGTATAYRDARQGQTGGQSQDGGIYDNPMLRGMMAKRDADVAVLGRQQSNFEREFGKPEAANQNCVPNEALSGLAFLNGQPKPVCPPKPTPRQKSR